MNVRFIDDNNLEDSFIANEKKAQDLTQQDKNRMIHDKIF